MSKKDFRLCDLLVFRNLHQFILHNLAGRANALAALVPYRYKLTQLLERLGTKLAYRLANCFVTYPITQTDVHNHSRSIYAQSVNENSYDYNSRDTKAERKKDVKKDAEASFFYSEIINY
jgi:hypothetical protein